MSSGRSSKALQVTGVNTALGAFRFRTPEEGWVLGFHVRPWRGPDGAVQHTKLRVTRPVPEDEAAAAKLSLPVLQVVSFLVRELRSTDEGTHTAQLDRAAQACAAQTLLELKNDSWLDDDEVEMSAPHFQQRLSLTSFSVEPEGEFSLGCDDGCLFFGYDVDVRGRTGGGFFDASIDG